MGLLSGILPDLLGDPSKDIRRASQDQLAFQREGLDYLKDINALPLEIRNQVLPMLQGFYTGDQGAQEALIESVQSSPFYQQMIETGQEGVLDRAGVMGLTRSGNTAQDLSRSNQGVLQSMVGQRLQGLQGLGGMPINSGAVANQLNMMGQNVGQAGIASANAEQAQMGNALSGLMAAFALSDIRLKKDAKPIGEHKGHTLYEWKWNDLAKELFNLSGEESGVIAQEVEKINSNLVSEFRGFKVVNYAGLIYG